MTTLRLFGRARSAAGVSQDVIEASDLAELLAIAGERYGREFADIAECSVVWVNGEQAATTRPTMIRPGDEVALLPPVAGG